jgi:hypothetical protein
MKIGISFKIHVFLFLVNLILTFHLRDTILFPLLAAVKPPKDAFVFMYGHPLASRIFLNDQIHLKRCIIHLKFNVHQFHHHITNTVFKILSRINLQRRITE